MALRILKEGGSLVGYTPKLTRVGGKLKSLKTLQPPRLKYPKQRGRVSGFGPSTFHEMEREGLIEPLWSASATYVLTDKAKQL
jgi:hypothetical protein